MRAFALKTKKIRFANPEDVISERKSWTPEDMMKPVLERGDPIRVELEIRPGAETIEFAIRPLTMTERDEADAILDREMPPQTFVEEQPLRPGESAKRIPSGYDYDHPKYLAAQRTLQDEQAAFVVLKGVDGLEKDTEGASIQEKVNSIRSNMPARMIKFLAMSIWNMSYAQGDPADFFTKGGSSTAPASASSPRPSRAVKS